MLLQKIQRLAKDYYTIYEKKAEDFIDKQQKKAEEIRQRQRAESNAVLERAEDMAFRATVSTRGNLIITITKPIKETKIILKGSDAHRAVIEMIKEILKQ